MVTKVTKISWDNQLADELCATFEELSKYIEGHSHTDEAMGAPPEIGDLEKMIKRVENLIQRAKPERKKEPQAAAA